MKFSNYHSTEHETELAKEIQQAVLRSSNGAFIMHTIILHNFLQLYLATQVLATKMQAVDFTQYWGITQISVNKEPSIRVLARNSSHFSIEICLPGSDRYDGSTKNFVSDSHSQIWRFSMRHMGDHAYVMTMTEFFKIYYPNDSKPQN